MASANSKPKEDAKEEVDIFGFQPCSQRPGAWVGAAYAFWHDVERESAAKDKGNVVTISPTSSPTRDAAGSSERVRSRSRSCKKDKGPEAVEKSQK